MTNKQSLYGSTCKVRHVHATKEPAKTVLTINSANIVQVCTHPVKNQYVFELKAAN